MNWELTLTEVEMLFSIQRHSLKRSVKKQSKLVKATINNNSQGSDGTL